jgi:glycosyltransferase involved in cell wall biosynthesis
MNLIAIYMAVFPKYAGFISGGEKHFLEVAREWVKNGHNLMVITTTAGKKVLRENKLNNIEVLLIRSPLENFFYRSKLGLALIYFIRMISGFLTLLNYKNFNKKVDVVYGVSHYFVDVILTIFLAKRLRSESFIYLHHLEPRFLSRKKYHTFTSSILSSLNTLLTISLLKSKIDLVFVFPFVKKILLKEGFSTQKLGLLENAIDIDKINKIPQGEIKYDVCYMGRLAPLKGILDIIDVAKILIEDYPDIRIGIGGGDGEEFKTMIRQKIFKEKLNDNIFLLGTMREEEKYRFLKSSKVFIYPSYEEGWAISVMEAMASGLPVVAYNLLAYEVFENAIIKVELRHKLALTEKIKEVLKNEHLRNSLIQKGLKITKQFNWREIAEKELRCLSLFV